MTEEQLGEIEQRRLRAMDYELSDDGVIDAVCADNHALVAEVRRLRAENSRLLSTNAYLERRLRESGQPAFSFSKAVAPQTLERAADSLDGA